MQMWVWCTLNKSFEGRGKIWTRGWKNISLYPKQICCQNIQELYQTLKNGGYNTDPNYVRTFRLSHASRVTLTKSGSHHSHHTVYMKTPVKEPGKTPGFWILFLKFQSIIWNSKNWYFLLLLVFINWLIFENHFKLTKKLATRPSASFGEEAPWEAKVAATKRRRSEPGATRGHRAR